MAEGTSGLREHRAKGTLGLVWGVGGGEEGCIVTLLSVLQNVSFPCLFCCLFTRLIFVVFSSPAQDGQSMNALAGVNGPTRH